MYTTIVFWALRTNYSMFTCMYVCEYVHTHILTYIHTRVSSQALHITVMEIIRIKALYISGNIRKQQQPLLLVLGEVDTTTWSLMCFSPSYNSFIQSNEAECAEFFSHYSLAISWLALARLFQAFWTLGTANHKTCAATLIGEVAWKIYTLTYNGITYVYSFTPI